MPVPALGPFSTVFAAAAILLADTEAFRALTETDSTDEALEKIRYPDWNVERDGPPSPGAVLYKWPGLTSQRISRQREEGGSLMLSLYGPMPETRHTTQNEELLEWSNVCGQIARQMLDLAKGPRPDMVSFYWDLVAVEELETAWLHDEETDVDICRVCTLKLEWGL
ncbi:MAG TPA: hypothetical protein DCQ94_06805 [Nitrospira sp.]|nr:hypothetical protein [Nitrospira sp.]